MMVTLFLVMAVLRFVSKNVGSHVLGRPARERVANRYVAMEFDPYMRSAMMEIQLTLTVAAPLACSRTDGFVLHQNVALQSALILAVQVMHPIRAIIVMHAQLDHINC